MKAHLSAPIFALLVVALLGVACAPVTVTPAAATAAAPQPAAATAALAQPATVPPAEPAVTQTAATAPAAAGAFADPFAYCAAVVDIDGPDARYTGPKIPDAVANRLMMAMGLTGTPPPPIAQGSFWRCMNGKVYACTVGANLPCQEKGNADKTPTQEMKDFCQANPTSDFIPMVVTGRATVYSWKCDKGTPVVDKQISEVDARGFLSNVWYEVTQ
jgi:hypothetical protein